MTGDSIDENNISGDFREIFVKSLRVEIKVRYTVADFRHSIKIDWTEPMRIQKIVIFLAVIALMAGGAWYWYSRGSQVHLHISPDKLMKYDNIVHVAVVGSGPAGLSAALYAARFNLYTVVFEGKYPGGQLMGTSDVENWPGMGRELGPKIIEKLRNQSLQFGAQFCSATIESIDTKSWPYTVKLDDGRLVHALTIIITTGASPVLLGIPGEQQYWGKGVTSCAVCDAPFFTKKTVVVVGGGDAAIEQALQLAGANAKDITMLLRSCKFRASPAMQQRVKAYDKITIRHNVKVKEILGNGKHVTGVKLQTEKGEEELATDGVFLAIGHTPNSSIVKGKLKLDSAGYILVDGCRQWTSQPGIFAAGDVADHFYRQAGIASGDGIKAAIDAADFLRQRGMDDAGLAPSLKRVFDPTAGKKAIELKAIGSVAELEELLAQEKRSVLLDFYTPQCPSCKQLMPIIGTVVEPYGTALVAVKIDGAALPDLMARYEVTTVPTLLVLKSGIVIGRSSSIASHKELKAFLVPFLE